MSKWQKIKGFLLAIRIKAECEIAAFLGLPHSKRVNRVVCVGRVIFEKKYAGGAYTI